MLNLKQQHFLPKMVGNLIGPIYSSSGRQPFLVTGLQQLFALLAFLINYW